MKILLTILLSSFITLGFSQTYETRKIILKADSILKSIAGDHIYKFFQYDSKTYYEYRHNNKSKAKTLNKNTKTRGDFEKSYVRFNFRHSDFPWIYGFASIRLDSLLNLSDPVDLSFIPTFLLKGQESNYISKGQAIKISADSILKGRIKNIGAELYYNHGNRTKKYTWVVFNYLNEKIDSFGNKYGEVDRVSIDPISGNIIEFQLNSYYGPLY